MGNGSILIPAEHLKNFTAEAFQRAGMSSSDAAIAAEVVTEADLRGLDSHGIIILPTYIQALMNGEINPRPNIKILKESRLHALMDGDLGMGQLVSVRGMKLCLDKARESGMGIVLAKRSCHFGAARYYSMMAAEQKFIGICATNTPPLLAFPGSKVSAIGNNPFSFAFPAARGYPIVFDMACSVAGRGKLNRHKDGGQKIPPEWGLDEEGRPTDDPDIALRSGLQPPVGGYKGFWLALAVECLTGALSGGPAAQEIPFLVPPTDVSHFFQAIDPELFTETYGKKIDGLTKDLRRFIPTKGKGETYLPGQRGWGEKEKRLKEGVPLLKGTLRRLQDMASKLGLEFPFEEERMKKKGE